MGPFQNRMYDVLNKSDDRSGLTVHCGGEQLKELITKWSSNIKRAVALKMFIDGWKVRDAELISLLDAKAASACKAQAAVNIALTELGTELNCSYELPASRKEGKASPQESVEPGRGPLFGVRANDHKMALFLEVLNLPLHSAVSHICGCKVWRL